MTLKRPVILLIIGFEARFFREVFQGVTAYSRQHTNWRLICQVEARACATIRQERPAGILAPSPRLRIKQLAQRVRIPYVRYGNAGSDPATSSVSADDRRVGAMAAEYLGDLGFKHFAYVGHGPWPFVGERLKGFSATVTSRGHGPVHEFMGRLYDRRQPGRFNREVDSMLRSLPHPCGLLAASDALGVLIVERCRAMGLRVPEDIAVVGVDDDQLACEMSEVPLSSVAQPLFTIGYEAASVLHQHIMEPRRTPTHVLLPPLRVVPRASSDLIALDDPDVVASLQLINYHFAQPINVAWIVDQLPVARRSLERKFKAMVGRTILEQIHHTRLQKARELLTESDMDLERVAQRSGLANASWLANSFRRDLNTTPTAYRRQFRNAS